MSEEVRFVRIRGRVVPIKSKGYEKKKKKERKKLALQSVAFASAGVGTSIAAGRKKVKTFKRAERTSQQAFRFAMEKTDYLPRGIKSAGEGFEKAGKQLKKAKLFGIGGQVVGGALLSQGVQRSLRSMGVDTDNPSIDIGAEIGSQIASGLIAREVKRSAGLPRKKFSISVPPAFKRLTKDLATRFVKKQLRLKI